MPKKSYYINELRVRVIMLTSWCVKLLFLSCDFSSLRGILLYEKIFGRTFVSTGGLETTKEFVELLNLKPGQKVLDVGGGIGGSAFYMAKVSIQMFTASIVCCFMSNTYVIFSYMHSLHVIFGLCFCFKSSKKDYVGQKKKPLKRKEREAFIK